ncbi:hypothetical protein DWB77_05524 [Streptomyces hundungensis]|uniref:Uncharacterized protein n=1 Tax=Streptomyces hundungensis TaxID=1077946 RepID=A0A387HQ87_9ACTN|nr:hypothetical protein DWB77_05524 [Streptomyces hundungensis]
MAIPLHQNIRIARTANSLRMKTHVAERTLDAPFKS